jgi:hypothetical protein
MLNLSLIVLHPVSLLCDYKVWIDTEIGQEVKNYFCNMVELNMMLKEFRVYRMAERKHAAYFAMLRWLVRSIKRSERRGHGSVCLRW